MAQYKNRTYAVIERARTWCSDHGYRFTKPRHAVLAIIAEAETPLTAYTILEQLHAYLVNPKPPTAYRAIDFLLQHGFIHRIESRNAFTLCASDHFHAGSQFIICDHCGLTREVHLCYLPDPIAARVREHNFDITYWDLELHGTCHECRTP